MKRSKIVFGVVAALCAASSSALAGGSIVINAFPDRPTPQLVKALTQLGVSQQDLSIATKAKRYIRENYGSDLPFSVNGANVHIITDDQSGQIVTVPANQL